MEERFDINQVQISGVIQKIWDYDQDIFLRLRFKPPEDKPDRFVTLSIPDGMVAGQLVSLQRGEMIQVEGHLVDVPYTEDIRQFFRDAKATNIFDSLEDKARWLNVQVKRIGTQVAVTSLAPVSNDPRLNAVIVQGIAVRVWRGGADLFTRLAIYDQHTSIISQEKGKLPRRKPHYITLRFIERKAGNKAVQIKKRQRLRVSGHLHVRNYKQSLEDVLKRADQVVLLKDIPEHQADEIAAMRESLYVVVESAILMTR